MAGKNLVPLVVLGLVAAGLVGWYVVTDTGAKAPKQTALGSEPARAAPSAQERASDTSLAVATDAADNAARVVPKPAAAKKNDQPIPDADLKDARWISGNVRFPENVPVDERAYVRAVGKDFARGGQHRAAIEPDGSFRVAFSKATEKGWLRVEGRYLYLENNLALDPAQPPAGIELAPKVGGAFRGVVKPSAAAQARWAEFVGANVIAQGSGQNGPRMRSLEARLDDQLGFELGGADPALHWRIELSVKGFAKAYLDDLGPRVGEITPLELPLIAGGHVTGKVLDESGAPVAKAEVRTGGSVWDRANTSAKTKDDGSFDIVGVPVGKLELTVSKAGFENKKFEQGEVADGKEVVGLALTLPRGAAISGFVRWPDGKPASNCKIQLTRVDEDEPWNAPNYEGKSTVDGSFSVSGLTAGSYTVRATSPPRAVAGSTVKAAMHAEMKDVKHGASGIALDLRAGGIVVGRVLDDQGQAVQNFRVVARPIYANDWNLRRENTISQAFKDRVDGAYEIGGLADGDWSLFADVKDGPASHGLKIKMPHDGKSLDLVLARPGKIRGVVLDALNAPARRAKVKIERDYSFDDIEVFGNALSADADDEGRFELAGVRAGSAKLVASLPGHANSEPIDVTVIAGGEVDGVVLRLSAGVTITGEVLDAANRPEPGRKVDLWGQRGTSTPAAVCDAAGRFRFEHVAPGHITLRVDATPEEQRTFQKDNEYDEVAAEKVMRSRSMNVAEGETVHVVLGGTPKDGIRIFGMVSAGGPLEGVSVSVSSKDGESSSTMRARTDAAGQFEMVAPKPGSLYLNVQTPSGSNFSSHKEVPPGSSFEWNIELSTGSIAGRVVDAENKPVRGSYVQLTSQSTEKGALQPHGWKQTKEGGEFRFDCLPAGKYALTANPKGMWIGETNSADSAPAKLDGLELEASGKIEDLVLRLETGGVIEGTVVDASGKGVPGARIMVTSANGGGLGGWNQAASDDAGRFQVTGIAPGTVSVRALTSGAVSRPTTGVVVRAQESTSVRLVLETAATLRVIVERPDGGVANARPSLRDESGFDASFGNAYAFGAQPASSDGTFQFSHLAPGRYTASIDLGADGKADMPVSLAAGEDKTIRLVAKKD